ncbi:MAG: glucose-1-phosphate adenylyltransferase subunit GlgD [Clostridia bacterium]|nr:glucose-1-phosphate adenylyltransferase subunit GlgD [Clostridia bacterium]
MINNAFGLIYTGENNPRLKDLTLSRSVAALPFGGRNRCIDFILSNLVNTGVTSVGMIMQKNYHSLMDHLGSGKEWNLSRKRDGLFILPPFMTKDNVGVYRGSIDAIRSCLGYVRRCTEKYVILSGSHTIFNMTFDDMLRKHAESAADITMMYNEDDSFNIEDQNIDLRLRFNDSGRVIDMELDPYRPKSNLRFCDVMVMEKALLEYLVEEAYSRGQTDFLRDIILKKCGTLKICGYRYDGFVARLDSINTYFKHSMQLLNAREAGELYNMEHPIYTKVKDEVPAKYGKNAQVKNTVLADGCYIDGTVENCILFRGVTVEAGAVVRNSIIMQGSTISKNAMLDHVILDKGVTIREKRNLIGYDNFPIVLRKNQTV